MAGTRGDVEFCSALSQEVLQHIPESEKRSVPCEPGDGGVNIYEASSSRNFNGSYATSKETAEKYLPKHARQYPAPAHA